MVGRSLKMSFSNGSLMVDIALKLKGKIRLFSLFLLLLLLLLEGLLNKLCYFSLLTSQRRWETETSSMKRFQASGFVMLWLRISVSTFAVKMSAKEIAILVPVAGSSMCL